MSKKAAAQSEQQEHEDKPPDQPWYVPEDPEQGVYRFIIAAARRARQLQAGARPIISTTSRKPTKIGMEEIRTGSVAVEFTSDEAFDELSDEEKAQGL